MNLKGFAALALKEASEKLKNKKIKIEVNILNEITALELNGEYLMKTSAFNDGERYILEAIWDDNIIEEIFYPEVTKEEQSKKYGEIVVDLIDMVKLLEKVILLNGLRKQENYIKF